jgi:hypothetical protein
MVLGAAPQTAVIAAGSFQPEARARSMNNDRAGDRRCISSGEARMATRAANEIRSSGIDVNDDGPAATGNGVPSTRTEGSADT